MSCTCSDDDVRECVANDRFRGIVDDCDADVGYGCMSVDVFGIVDHRLTFVRRHRMPRIRILHPVFLTLEELATSERSARAVAVRAAWTRAD